MFHRKSLFIASLSLFLIFHLSLSYAAVDRTPPTGTIKINNGASSTNSINVTLNLSAKDTGLGVSQMKFSNNNRTWTTPEPYAATKSWTLSPGSGTKKVYVKYKDNAGNWSGAYSDTIILDTTLPTGSIKINNNAAKTNSTQVALTLSATDTYSGVSVMEFSNDNSTWSTPEIYATTKIWTIPLGDGTKTVYVKFRDRAGNWSAVYPDTIILDTTAPVISNVGASEISSKSAKIFWNTDEPAIGQVEYGLTSAYGYKTSISKTLATSLAVTISKLKEYTLYHYRAISKDSVGNQAASGDFTFTTKDSTAPTGTIKINNGATSTNNINVTLNLSAADTGSGVAQMKFSNNNSTWSAAESYATTKAWTLALGNGLKRVYVKYKDNSGNWSTTYSDSINLPNQTPQVGTITPSSGNSNPQETVTFTTTYSDSNGWQNIKEAHFLINTAANGANCFYAYYDQNNNKLYLRNDANSAWLGGYAPNTTKTIENSYAKLDCSKTTISGDNITLTVKWTVVLKATFLGTKNTYLYVKDDANVYTGWTQKGTWSISTSPNQPPVINSISPSDNSTFLAGAKINIQINATDPDNDPLQYQFSIGGTIKQPWSSLNTYTWQTTASDVSSVGINCEVRDNKGAVNSRAISCRIINPTVEEILGKVVDNYAKIYDFKADMVLSSTLNGQPFGETEYCRYYFKAPNKEKTESFTDSYRTTKTEVIIIDGSNMYLIDAINRITQEIDFLTEAGISGAQFNQMDIHYNIPNFLNNHTVTRDNAKTDFINLIIALDAIPKTQNNLYSKLELYVDYNKGLLVKSCLYKENESRQMKLLQTIETVETQRMPNGAWLPRKINKIPVLTSGNLIETATYSNLQINVGLTDLDFDLAEQY